MGEGSFKALGEIDPGAAAKLVQELRGKIVVPHSGGQQEVVASQARYRVLRAGRRWGKTKLAAREIVNAALTADPDDPPMIWWVANSYKNVRRGYRMVLQQLPRRLLAKDPPPATANELHIHLKNGAIIEFYSGGSPDSMAGEGVDFVVIDEAALIPEHVWFQIVEPTLLDTGGRALIISTPRGRNWFWKMWQYGQDESQPEYESWHFTSYDNPFIPNDRIDAMRKNNPEQIANQEIMADFLDSGSAVFNLAAKAEDGSPLVKVVPEVVQPVGWITMGCDLAKHQDFTVLTARRPDAMPVWHERFRHVRWSEQKQVIIDAVEYLEGCPGVEGVTVGVDTGGPGDVVFDDLEDYGLDVEAVKFSEGGGNTQKNRMVRLLGSDLEQGRAILLEDQRAEFEAFEYQITASGNMTYQAPSGMHDDEVAAKMIEHWVAVHRGPSEALDDAFTPEEAEDEDTGEVEIIRPATAADLMNREEVWR